MRHDDDEYFLKSGKMPVRRNVVPATSHYRLTATNRRNKQLTDLNIILKPRKDVCIVHGETRARISGGTGGCPPTGFLCPPTVCVHCIPTGDRKCPWHCWDICSNGRCSDLHGSCDIAGNEGRVWHDCWRLHQGVLGDWRFQRGETATAIRGRPATVC